MIDWLDPEAVRKDKEALKARPCCQDCVVRWPDTTSHRVLEAIAALPEPTDWHADWCTGVNSPCAPACCEPFALRRIWLVAKEVVGE